MLSRSLIDNCNSTGILLAHGINWKALCQRTPLTLYFYTNKSDACRPMTISYYIVFSCISSMMNLTKWFVKVFAYGVYIISASVWHVKACGIDFFSIFSFHFTLIVLAVVTAGYYIIFSEWFHYFFHTKCALLKCQVNITFIRNKVEVLNIHLGLNIGLYCGVWQNNLLTYGIYD